LLVVDAKKGNALRVTIGNDPTIRQLLASYYSHVEVLDRAGNRGVGVTNLKRMFGYPDELRLLVTALAGFVTQADAIAAADSGAAPLTAALAFRLAMPAVFVRSTPKTHFLSYGGDPQSNHPLLSGEQLPGGSRVVIIDDLLHSGATVISAAKTLGEVDVVGSAVSCMLAAPPDGWRERLQQAGFESVSALALTTDL
jgi:adenine/guanine phosphoribosyltransferase-like PRPP-binding protein